MNKIIKTATSAGHPVFRGHRHVIESQASSCLRGLKSLSFDEMGPSFWAGSLTSLLGLSITDPIVHAHLENALCGKHPKTGERLPGGCIRKIPKWYSYEILFPVFESVSIASQSDPRIERLFENLVRQIIILIETDAMFRDRHCKKVFPNGEHQCGTPVTSKPSNGILVAVTIKYPDRWGYPGMHANAQIMNFTRDTKGRYVLLNLEKIISQLKPLSQLFNRHLKSGLHSLGYRVVVTHGNWLIFP